MVLNRQFKNILQYKLNLYCSSLFCNLSFFTHVLIHSRSHSLTFSAKMAEQHQDRDPVDEASRLIYDELQSSENKKKFSLMLNQEKYDLIVQFLKSEVPKTQEERNWVNR